MADETAMRTGRRWLAGAALVVLAGSMAACGGDDDATADFCEKYRSYEDQNQQVSDDLTDDPENVDIDEIKKTFTDVAKQVDDLRGEAPDEIKDDVEKVSTAVSDLADDVESADDPEAVVQAISEGTKDSDDVDQAGTRIDDWVADNCDSDGEK